MFSTCPQLHIFCLILLALLLAPNITQATEVSVKGKAELTANINLTERRISGVLKDDQQQPLGHRQLRIVANSNTPTPFFITGTNCSSLPSKSSHRVAQGIQTDATGAFCVELSRTPQQTPDTLAVIFDGESHYTKAQIDISLVAPKRQIQLQLRLASQVLPLEATNIEVEIESSSSIRCNAKPKELQHIDIVLVTQKPAEAITLATVDDTLETPQRRMFSGAALKAPGKAELRAVFRGNACTFPAEQRVEITRTLTPKLYSSGFTSSLTAGEPLQFTIASGTPTGAMLEGTFTTLFDGTPQADTNATAPNTSFKLLTDPHKRGCMRVDVVFHPARAGWNSASLHLGTVQLHGPSFWRYTPGFLLTIGLLFWASRLRHGRQAGRQNPFIPPHKQTSFIGVRVHQTQNASNWIGQVLDAHEGIPICNAHIEIVEHHFDNEAIVQEANSDDQGYFTLGDTPQEAARRYSQLRIQHPEYSDFSASLPEYGTLDIRMARRRRAILTHLLSWAEQRGEGWLWKPAITPNSVARRAAELAQQDTEQWARNVEFAAFGPEAPSAVEEARLTKPERTNAQREEQG